MRTNQAKAKILNGGTAYGVFCTFFAPAVVEMMGHIGFDFVLIDAEHGPSGTESCEHMVRAAETVGIAPFIRVAVNIRQNILRYLDIGSLGVQLPMVNNGAEAKGDTAQCVVVVSWPVSAGTFPAPAIGQVKERRNRNT